MAAEPAVRRFLEVVARELGADDTRAELGGRDPSGPGIVFKNLASGWRIVAIFDRAPADHAAAQAKLDRLAESFSHTLADGGSMLRLIAEGSIPTASASCLCDARARARSSATRAPSSCWVRKADGSSATVM